MGTNTEHDVHRMLCLIFGGIHAQAITAAAELGIPELLHQGASSAERLAEETGAAVAPLERLLRLLVRLEVLGEPQPGRYALTDLGALLRRDSAHSLYNYARLTNCEMVAQVAARMRDGVETGVSQFSALFGGGFYEALPQRPAEAEKFAGAMEDIARQDILAIDDACDFSECRTLVDVGGGQGHLLSSLLDAYPELHGVLLDLPEVAGQLYPPLQGHVDSGRCTVVAGDFLDAVPPGGDVYVVKRVLSHLGDGDAATLLGNIRASMQPSGRVLIADPDPDSLYGASFDVLMLVLLGGGLRTQAQLDVLFRRSGLAGRRAFGGSAALRFVEAVPARAAGADRA